MQNSIALRTQLYLLTTWSE